VLANDERADERECIDVPERVTRGVMPCVPLARRRMRVPGVARKQK
jgi:hypothetical protein